MSLVEKKDMLADIISIAAASKDSKLRTVQATTMVIG
jgi:hypothetical protein